MLAEQVPYIYLCGGAATLITARLVGRMTDRRGKVQTFTLLACAVMVLMFAMTLLPRVPLGVVLGVVLGVSKLFFICMSGRMIPGMAIITSAANPALRATFMALNASVQSAAMGAAAFLGGSIISRDAQGLVQHYWGAAGVRALASLLAIVMARRLTLHGALLPRVAPEAALSKA